MAVVFGGRSSEHAISCVSAGSVLRHLDRERFDVVPVGITRDGAWVLGTDDPGQLAIARPRAAVGGPVGAPPSCCRATRPAAGWWCSSRAGPARCSAASTSSSRCCTGPSARTARSRGCWRWPACPTSGRACWPARPGWTRSSPRSCSPRTACRSATSWCCARTTATLTAAQRDRLGLPVFVKPARAGSSVGITRVTDWAELDAAIAAARAHDPKVLVEAAIVGPRGRVRRAGAPGRDAARERCPPRSGSSASAAFYDFDAKYLDDVCEFDIPAKLDDDVVERVQETAVAAFRALDCQGLARVDFFVGADGDPGGQRGEHDARLHADLDVPADVGGHRRRLPDAAGDLDRHRARPGHRAPVADRPDILFIPALFRCDIDVIRALTCGYRDESVQ